MPIYKNKPSPFFDLVVHDLGLEPSLTGANAGYEAGKFRNDEMANYLFEWLPEFAMKYSELEELNSGTAIRMIQEAARTVYTTEKYGKRGEFGELLLHALLREVFDSEPAISKIYYKSSTNETVKGFDAVHIVDGNEGLELWLGEVKFYKDKNAAIRDITKEIIDHTELDYLRDEFILIGNKLDPKWKNTEAVKDLISKRKSLDESFTRVCIPALITYESKCVNQNEKGGKVFSETLRIELDGIYQQFIEKDLPGIRIHLFLVPLAQKEDLINRLHHKLEGMQR